MKELKITTIRGEAAKRIAEVLDDSGIIIYRPRSESGSTVLDVLTETRDENFNRLMAKLNEGYKEYKKNHPDFTKVVEEEEHKLKGNYGRKKTHCESCGSWLQGFDMCDECGRINK